jgi:hypothetical protein
MMISQESKFSWLAIGPVVLRHFGLLGCYNLFMNETDTLRYARNILLSLHKSLIDLERTGYERIHGSMNAGQFLNALLEDEYFAWLRKFSMLIVEIDEMFDLKDGITAEMVRANLAKITQLVGMNEADDAFRVKYQNALQNDVGAASLHAQLQGLLTPSK